MACAYFLEDVERDTILAALRYWQMDGFFNSRDPERKREPQHEWLVELATNGGDHELFNGEELDKLCEKINPGEPTGFTPEEEAEQRAEFERDLIEAKAYYDKTTDDEFIRDLVDGGFNCNGAYADAESARLLEIANRVEALSPGERKAAMEMADALINIQGEIDRMQDGCKEDPCPVCTIGAIAQEAEFEWEQATAASRGVDDEKRLDLGVYTILDSTGEPRVATWYASTGGTGFFYDHNHSTIYERGEYQVVYGPIYGSQSCGCKWSERKMRKLRMWIADGTRVAAVVVIGIVCLVIGAIFNTSDQKHLKEEPKVETQQSVAPFLPGWTAPPPPPMPKSRWAEHDGIDDPNPPPPKKVGSNANSTR